MRKKIILFLIVIGVVSLISARVFTEEEGGETLRFKYHFKEPNISSSGEFQSIKVRGLKQYRAEGQPILPFRTIKILMPYGRTFSGAKVTASPMAEIAGTHLIEPGQSPYISQVERIPPDPKIYSSDKPFLDEIFKIVTIQNKRGYRILYINLFPVKYIPSQRKLFWCNEIDVEISTRTAPVAGGYRGLAKDKRLIAGQVENRGTAETYPLKQQSH